MVRGVSPELRKIKVIAHRGASGYAPENSLSAIRLALSMGADFVEIDVRRTSDGHLVVIHDSRVDRVTNGSGYVSRLRFRRLRRFSLPNGEHIPTLEEVLGLFKRDFPNSRSKLRIHVKSPGYEDGVLDAILSSGLVDKVRIVGRRPIVRNFAAIMRQMGCSIELGLTGRFQPLGVAEELGVVEVSPEISLLTRTYVKRAHELGIEVFTWPVNNAWTLARARELGVDGIITDYPDIVNLLTIEAQRFTSPSCTTIN